MLSNDLRNLRAQFQQLIDGCALTEDAALVIAVELDAAIEQAAALEQNGVPLELAARFAPRRLTDADLAAAGVAVLQPRGRFSGPDAA
jgi:hypothetical protein